MSESQTMDGLTDTQRAFAEALLASGAVKFGAFRLKLHETQPDAPLSPLYLDLRVLQSYPDALDAAVAALRELIVRDGLWFACYAGIPLAATPLVAVLSHITRVPMLTPREEKSHGASGTINGAFTPGETALVIDDVVSHADSKIEAIHVLEAAGLRVADVAVLVDREQGGPEQLAAAGYTLHAAVRLSQLLAHWRTMGGIDDVTYARVHAYMAGA
ncbi:MAG: orotate phosphoribosyltransferase [Ktedonobacterales bacterium]